MCLIHMEVGATTTDTPCPYSPKGDGPQAMLAKYAKRAWGPVCLMDYTAGICHFSLHS